MLKYKLIFFILLFFIFTTYGQETKNDSIKNLKFNWIIAPAYTPELGGMLSLSGIFSFKTDKNDSLIQRSSFPISFGYSTSGAIIYSGILTSFWNEDKIRLSAYTYFKSMPDNYWGVGYNNAISTDKSKDSTGYHKHWWQIKPKLVFEIKKDFFLGFVLDVNQTYIIDSLNDRMKRDPYIKKFGTDNFNVGIGFTGQYDTRDIPVNSYRGVYISYSALYYDKAFGGDNTYMSGDIDLRFYKYINSLKGVFAFQTRFRGVTYGAPYAELSQIGTPFDLRGYFWGQYRDNIMLYSILEYRYMFSKKIRKLKMRDGIVLWAGLGTVAHHFNSIKYGLPNIGIGYRIEVQKRMNVRFDLGFGQNTTGFYINFNEAF